MSTTTIPQWHLAGKMVQACNCEYGCPCEFNAPPSHGHCHGTWSWHVEEGGFGDIDLAGVHFAASCMWPGAIHEGNGEALPILDDRMTPEQMQAVGTLLSGQAGGPWGIIATTLTKVHEPKVVSWDYTFNGSETAMRAGDVLSMQLTPIRNPVTNEIFEATVMLPTGFTSKALNHATTSEYFVRDEINVAYPGKDSAWGEFSYDGPPA